MTIMSAVEYRLSKNKYDISEEAKEYALWKKYCPYLTPDGDYLLEYQKHPCNSDSDYSLLEVDR